MPLNVRPLSAELQKVARDELNEDPARTEQDLEHIREWLKKQPHINARTDDQWLLAFLRGCKFSLERTKEKLDCYYTMRTLLPDILGDRDPMKPEIQEMLKTGMYLPLPVTDANGRRVYMIRVGALDPSTMKLQNAFKVNLMLMDIMMMEDDELIVNGVVNLIDFKDASVAHMMQMTPALAKKITTALQEGFPIRPKQMNYINLPSMFQTVFNMVKSLFKEKLQSRVVVHANMEQLQAHLSKELLPAAYGGNAGTIDELIAYWKKKVESYRDWFIEEEQFKTDEKKRVGKPKTQESLFGLEGSFRQLAVD